MHKIYLAFASTLIGTVTTGCGVDGSDTSVIADEIGSAVTEAPLLAHGGTGGSLTSHVTPPAVIYGVQVNSGANVDHIKFLYYQPTHPSNRYAGEQLLSVDFGGDGGRTNAVFLCPENQGIIGLRGSSGRVIDRIGVICSDVTNPSPSNTANAQSPQWGGDGGSSFDERCGAGRLMTSLNVRSGRRIDNLQAICRDAR